MHIIRVIGAFWLAFLFCTTVAWAQVAETEPTPVPAPAPPIVELQQPSTSDINISDPAIQAALEARDAAEAELVKVIREQAKAAEQNEASPETDAPKKKSLIPTNAEDFKSLLNSIGEKLLGWLTSMKFLAQVGAVVTAIILSPIVAKIIRKKLFFFKAPPAEDAKLLPVRKIVYQTAGFLRAALLVVLLALFAAILKAVPAFGDDWLVKIAQSLAMVFLIYRAIKTFISDPLLSKVLVYTLIPLGLCISLGYFDELTGFLDGANVFMIGDTQITLMSLIRLGLFGSAFFWLGGISNKKGQAAIRSQETLDVGVREIVAKLFQILLFVVVTFLVMSAAGIPLSGLVVVFSAVALGIGFGLQPVAANFVSGLIILFDRSVRVGDFVVLPDGQEGFVEAINMRSTIVETTDGKDIMVPNTKFIEDAYENWTHKDPRQRYEVHFTVAYDTDLDTLEDILIPEVLNHPSVLEEPEMPDLEFRKFGLHGVDMAIEFWCSGIDDGPNKFSSDINFIVWRALRDHKVTIAYPQLVVHSETK